MQFSSFMMLATNIVAIALIGVILIQGQTSTGLGSAFGGSDIYRTRRGMEMPVERQATASPEAVKSSWPLASG